MLLYAHSRNGSHCHALARRTWSCSQWPPYFTAQCLPFPRFSFYAKRLSMVLVHFAVIMPLLLDSPNLGERCVFEPNDRRVRLRATLSVSAKLTV